MTISTHQMEVIHTATKGRLNAQRYRHISSSINGAAEMATFWGFWIHGPSLDCIPSNLGPGPFSMTTSPRPWQDDGMAMDGWMADANDADWW